MTSITYKTWTLTQEELESNVNQAAKNFVQDMGRHNIIDPAVAKTINESYAIIIRKPSFFGKIWAKIVGNDNISFITVEQLTLDKEANYGKEQSEVHEGEKVQEHAEVLPDKGQETGSEESA